MKPSDLGLIKLKEWPLPGALMGDEDEWWKNTKLSRDAQGNIIGFSVEKGLKQGLIRLTPHEGLDLVLFVNPYGQLHPLWAGTGVRPVADGEVAGIIKDALCETMIIRHSQIRDQHGRIAYSYYTHVKSTVKAGNHVTTKDMIVRIADPQRENPKGRSPPFAFFHGLGSRELSSRV